MATVNGVAGGRLSGLKAKRGKRAVKAVSRARQCITLGLGCGIPGLSLALSSIGGRLLCEGQAYLGGAALVLCSTVLAVSLS
jgi:hypothetical protein